MIEDKELNKKIESDYKKISLIVITIGIILSIPIFFIPENLLHIYTIAWMILMIVVIGISPKILRLFKNV